MTKQKNESRHGIDFPSFSQPESFFSGHHSYTNTYEALTTNNVKRLCVKEGIGWVRAAKKKWDAGGVWPCESLCLYASNDRVDRF